ncbi:hypothetical protein KR018_007220 [Drosophila ironensis]|nr:hypothetical protein KR018_007220 [Drosophila ironensis]
MGASFCCLHQWMVLGFILVALSPAEILADRKLIIRKLEKFNEDSDALHSHLRISEDKENFLKVDGELKVKTEIDNSWKISVKVSKASSADGDFQDVWTLRRLGVCDAMKTYYKDFFYDKLKEYSNAPAPHQCPVPEDDYKLEDYPMDVRFLKKLLKPGYYRIVSKLRDGEDVKLEYRTELEIED